MMINDKDKIRQSLDRVERWVEAHGYKGYEPFDGLSSPLRALTFGNLLLERVLQQAVRRLPVNIRPLIGVRPQESTKGRGYMAAGYLQMHRLTGSPDYLLKARTCLAWLDEHRSPFYESHSWGNHFLFSSRGGRLPAQEPIIVWTAIIGLVYADAWELTGEGRYRDIVRSVCDWILALPRERTASGTCLSYVTYQQQSIHNSNMLGSAMLARAHRILGDPVLLETARETMAYSCSRQRPDGSWWYGEAPFHQWIDNFHTGYNLDSLRSYIESTGDRQYDAHLAKGLHYYRRNFFLEDGTPKYYHDKVYPVDSQCVSQAIETLALFGTDDPESLALGLKVAHWAIDHMQDKKRGCFHFRLYPFGIRDKTPMLHWAQATMYKGLTTLYARL